MLGVDATEEAKSEITEKRLLEEIKKGVDIFEGIVNNVLDEKGLGNICQVAGLDNERRDGSVEYYLSEKIVYNDAKGVGPFMMAYSEYIKSIVK